MAFKTQNLYSYGGNVKSGVVPNSWVYWNEENDAVTGAGFINSMSVKVGDSVRVINNTKTSVAEYFVTAVAGGKATLTASA